MDSFDSFADDVSRESGASRKAECSVGLMLGRLDAADAERVKTVLARPEMTSSAIRRALATRVSGNLPSLWTLNRHRRKDCSCWTTGGSDA